MDEQQPLWDWSSLTAALNIESETGAAGRPQVYGLAFDSRNVEPGDLFIALPGDPGPKYNVSQRSQRDGHEFVDAAQARGAVAALTHDGRARRLPQLQVADTLQALQQLARHRRDHCQAVRLAVTGSSGKTTAKTFLRAALGAHASEGSFNNHLGVPLSLASMPLDARFGVFEVGTNHPGEIAPLSDMVAPTVALLLNVHAAHLENFANRDALVSEKLDIAHGLRPGGWLVVEDQVPISASLTAELQQRQIQICRFGEGVGCAVQLLGLNEQATGSYADYDVRGRKYRARVPGGGWHRALSLAAVLAALTALNLDPQLACELPDDLVPQGRGNLHHVRGATVLDDSYNANPDSMAAALTLLATSAGAGKRYAVLGDMLELGEQSKAAHLALRPLCEQLDGVWLVGEAMAVLAAELPVGNCRGHWLSLQEPGTTAEMLRSIHSALQEGDRLLVKGSNRLFWQAGFVGALIEHLNSQQDER